MAAHGVDLVDKDHGRGAALGRLEQIAHARRADAHEHFDKVRARDGEERHFGLARHRLGQQRLAGSRRAHEQHALGNARADFIEALRLAHELHDLAQLLLLLIRAGHICKRDLVRIAHLQPRARTAKVHHLLAAALLAHHEIVQRANGHEQQQIRQNDCPDGLLHDLRLIGKGIVVAGDLIHAREPVAVRRIDDGGHVGAERRFRRDDHVEIRVLRQVLRACGTAGVQAIDIPVLDLDRLYRVAGRVAHFGTLYERKKLGVVIQFFRLFAAQIKSARHPDDRERHQHPDQQRSDFLVVQSCILLLRRPRRRPFSVLGRPRRFMRRTPPA